MRIIFFLLIFSVFLSSGYAQVFTKGSVDYYINKAKYYAASRNFEAAISSLTKAIETDPSLAITYFYRANVYNNWMHKYDEAIADYTSAIERDPLFKIAYICRVDLLEKKGLYDQAIADYAKLRELCPPLEMDCPHFYYRAAQLCEKAERIEEAIKLYREFIPLALETSAALRYPQQDLFHQKIVKAKKKVRELSWKIGKPVFISTSIDRKASSKDSQEEDSEDKNE